MANLNLLIAVPHSDVGPRDFYKLIEQSIPEPRRMKQLLTWCGTRALPAKTGEKSKDANEVVAMETGMCTNRLYIMGYKAKSDHIARHIQEELLKDFASKPELSDWFSRVSISTPLLSLMKLEILTHDDRRMTHQRQC